MSKRNASFLVAAVALLSYAFAGHLLYSSFFKPTPTQMNVDLRYLAEHPDEFVGKRVEVRGTVLYPPSSLMFEDFWLVYAQGGGIPIVFRSNDMTTPRDNTSVELEGVVSWASIESGSYYIDATSWIYEGYYTILLLLFWTVLLQSICMATYTFDTPFRYSALYILTFIIAIWAPIVCVNQYISSWSGASARGFAPLISGFHVVVASSILTLTFFVNFVIRISHTHTARLPRGN